MCDCLRHHGSVGACTCTCSEHLSLRLFAYSRPEEDLEVIHDMRPDLLRQWIIEKMLENGAIKEFMDAEMFPAWAHQIEIYIREGYKKEETDAEIP